MNDEIIYQEKKLVYAIYYVWPILLVEYFEIYFIFILFDVTSTILSSDTYLVSYIVELNNLSILEYIILN